METSCTSSYVEDHSRVLIHIDLDCFYAQVEMIKNPNLYTVPLGIQQKSIVVTSNYVARQFGIKKCMLVAEALKLCPTLVLVKGEDLYNYRQMSYKVTTYLQKYSTLVERLGLDENYVDITYLVNERIRTHSDMKLAGNLFGNSSENCTCGCELRLKVGSTVAQEIREGLKNELELTSCAGIAHNKLLAKLVGSTHKPNQQTTLFPNSALELLLTLPSIKSIPGIGDSTAELLESLGVKTIEDVQNCEAYGLQKALGLEKAKWVCDMSYGRDASMVKATGKPQSIGLEDSCKSLSAVEEVKEKLLQLLNRLVLLISEDGRAPRTIKLTVRKFDKMHKISHRETRQCNVCSSLLALDKNSNSGQLSSTSEKKLMGIIMHLFKKLVDVTKPYHITLLGLSFTKFQERLHGKASISSYLRKDVAVQSLTSIENKIIPQNLLRGGSYTPQKEFHTDGSESEIEPSPKKLKFAALTAKRRCFSYDADDCASPSKLRVAKLRLDSKELERPVSDFTDSDANKGCSFDVPCPPNASKEVFEELPNDVQQELWEDWKRQRSREQSTCNRQAKKPKNNTLLNYFVKN